MDGPIDTRKSPTLLNRFAVSTPIEWFEENLIGTVPPCYAGATRRVYPGFMQLNTFTHMNLERHANFLEYLQRSLIEGDYSLAGIANAAYAEYFAVMDLTAEFYLETVRHVFQEHSLPRGRLECCGRPVEPASIRLGRVLVRLNAESLLRPDSRDATH
jgi:poly(3-hydroxybutyrate) depolymerase